MIIFIHIWKCGGHSFRKILRDRYGDALCEMKGGREREILESLIAAPNGIKAVHGHMPIGLDRHVKGEYMTMLRHPVARVVSEYHFAKVEPMNGFHEKINDGMGLVDFARETADNVMVRFLQARDIKGEWFGGDMTESNLTAAKANLATFAFVGLVERYDDEIDRLRLLRGWPIETVPHINRTCYPAPTDAEIAEIAKHNRLDLKLYESVRWTQEPA